MRDNLQHRRGYLGKHGNELRRKQFQERDIKDDSLMKLTELMEGRDKCSIFQTYLDNKITAVLSNLQMLRLMSESTFSGVARQKFPCAGGRAATGIT